MKRDRFENYKFFKGEEECPSKMFRTGKGVWWMIESIAYDNNDDKKKNELSPSMIKYIKEKVWQRPEGYWDTSWEVALERATELYRKGLWDIGYICENKENLDRAY